MKYGFIKVAAAIPPVTVADCHSNARGMVELARQAASQDVEWIVFSRIMYNSIYMWRPFWPTPSS